MTKQTTYEVWVLNKYDAFQELITTDLNEAKNLAEYLHDKLTRSELKAGHDVEVRFDINEDDYNYNYYTIEFNKRDESEYAN